MKEKMEDYLEYDTSEGWFGKHSRYTLINPYTTSVEKENPSSEVRTFKESKILELVS